MPYNAFVGLWALRIRKGRMARFKKIGEVVGNKLTPALEGVLKEQQEMRSAIPF
jgi:hypothetical protein